MIDLITMKAFYFDGSNGEKVRTEEIPADLKEEAAEARTHMLEALSMYSDELMELLLGEEEVPEKLIHKIVRDATINQGFTPVFLGSAYKNKGVQLLMDAVTRYLPSPLDRDVHGHRPEESRREDHARQRSRPSRSSAWRSRSWTTSSASSPSPASTRARPRRARCTSTSAPARRTASAAS